MDRVDAVVVGAGVVGLAVGRALALRGLDTLLLERETAIGTQTSARNSEVLHAGIYGVPGSLKAGLCVAGRAALAAYCASRGVAQQRCGKLIVAVTEAERPRLAALHAQAVANGVRDLQALDGVAARELEPALRCVAALLSPSTGIVDSHALMLALQADFERAGGIVAVASPVAHIDCTAGHRSGACHRIDVAGMALGARLVVNAAGLGAPALTHLTRGLPPAWRADVHFAKGSYFSLAGRAPFSRLVYPVPEAAGLGVHMTLDLAGQARFGPDVEWIAPDANGRLDYRVDPARGPLFEAAVRRYWPALPDGALQPAYSGVRPKLAGAQSPPCDFRIDGPDQHGVPGLVNLLGIESPGLTACLAIADRVCERLAVPLA